LSSRDALKPILIIEHVDLDGPGNFAAWLARHGLPSVHVRIHAGDPVPDAAAPFSGLCVLGGPMSANDEHLPHIRAELALLRDAIAGEVPVIGHCLGGQMLARALGATVGPAPAPELGWQPIGIEPGAAARRWFGERSEQRVVQWHFETFSLPAGAQLLATGDTSRNQAFEWGGLHLGMQFHVEVDAAKASAWLAEDGDDLRRFRHVPSVQQADQLAADSERLLEPMRELAWHLYDTWAQRLRR
jgi:GMP synthase-like glutamine amidotransferase